MNPPTDIYRHARDIARAIDAAARSEGVHPVAVAEIASAVYRGECEGAPLPHMTDAESFISSQLLDHAREADLKGIALLSVLRVLRERCDRAAEWAIEGEIDGPASDNPWSLDLMPIEMIEPKEFDEALAIARSRGLLPTSLDTYGIRERFAPGVRARAVFSAETLSANYLSGVKRAVEEILEGNAGAPAMRAALGELLGALGYRPEEGFAGYEGEVPPAVEGTIKDLSSRRRIDLVVTTQVDLMRGAGQKARGEEPWRLDSMPFWKLIRVEQREEPRDWAERWAEAGGELLPGGVMAAPKGAPVWEAIGSSERFDDALDTDHPPFAFYSGMGWREMSHREGQDLGLDPDDARGTPPGEGLESELPRPKASTLKMDPDVLAGLKEKLRVIEADGAVEYNGLLERGAR